MSYRVHRVLRCWKQCAVASVRSNYFHLICHNAIAIHKTLPNHVWLLWLQFHTIMLKRCIIVVDRKLKKSSLKGKKKSDNFLSCFFLNFYLMHLVDEIVRTLLTRGQWTNERLLRSIVDRDIPTSNGSWRDKTPSRVERVEEMANIKST